MELVSMVALVTQSMAESKIKTYVLMGLGKKIRLIIDSKEGYTNM